MGAEVSNQSNSFLPFGKVRMGYPSGEGQIPLAVSLPSVISLSSVIINRSNQPLPFGGEREGAVIQYVLNQHWVYPGFLLQNTGLSYKHTDIGPHLTSPEGEGQIL